MKVYIGSTNNNKVNATKLVLEKEGYHIIACEVSSKVGAQPMNDEETIKGALNRASALPCDGLRIGLEAGVQELNDVLYLTNFGVLIDEKGNKYFAGGTRIPLPDKIKTLIIDEKLELSDAMYEYFHTVDIKHHSGAIGYFTNNQVTRIDIFTHIIKLLYGQYLFNKEEK